MKIVFLLNSYIRGMSGGDTWAIEVGKRLSEKADEFVVITPKRAMNLWNSELNTIKIIASTKEHDPNGLISLYIKRIVNFFSLTIPTSDSDILFATSIFIPDIIPMLFLKGKKIAIFHMQAPHPLFGYKYMIKKSKKIEVNLGNLLNWFNEKISIIILKLIRAKFFVLSSTKEIVIQYGFTESDLMTTRNGIDLEYIDSIKSDETTFDACWIGRPHPQKGLDDLISIWGKIIEKHPDKKLVLMGENISIYKSLIEENNLSDKIILKGYVSNEEKIKIMKSSRLFVSTSYFESFHIAVLEALACNIPVLAYDLPVYHQIYGDILHYVQLGNKDQYVSVMEQLFTDDIKPNLDIQKQFVEQFDWNVIANDVWKKLSENLK